MKNRTLITLVAIMGLVSCVYVEVELQAGLDQAKESFSLSSDNVVVSSFPAFHNSKLFQREDYRTISKYHNDYSQLAKMYKESSSKLMKMSSKVNKKELREQLIQFLQAMIKISDQSQRVNEDGKEMILSMQVDELSIEEYAEDLFNLKKQQAELLLFELDSDDYINSLKKANDFADKGQMKEVLSILNSETTWNYLDKKIDYYNKLDRYGISYLEILNKQLL